MGERAVSDRTRKRVDEMIELFQLRGLRTAKPIVNYPVGNNSEWHWLGRSRLDHSCCYWMNRSPHWTRRLGSTQRRTTELARAIGLALNHRDA